MLRTDLAAKAIDPIAIQLAATPLPVVLTLGEACGLLAELNGATGLIASLVVPHRRAGAYGKLQPDQALLVAC